MIHIHWLSSSHNESHPLAQHNTPWFRNTGLPHLIMIHSHWLSIAHHDAHTEPIGVNHDVLCWANGYESCGAMLSQWLWIMVCNTEPVTVNHGVLCWISDRKSCFVMLIQWLWNIVFYAKQVLLKHCVLCQASDCESWCVIQSTGEKM
jgi:hypothetical protein